MLKVCVDTNIWISGILFSGKPSEIVTAAFGKKFQVVLSQVILDEVERNLLFKFKLSRSNTKKLINRILQISDIYEPSGSVHAIPKHHADNLVLETAANFGSASIRSKSCLLVNLVEVTGIEPAASNMPCLRSPS
jgi:putative PIN family toxin of toxin-antitoxin system